MTFVFVVLLGALVGAGIGRWMRETVRSNSSVISVHESDYETARRAIMSHVHSNGTVNLVQVEHLLDLPGPTALKCLNLMVADGHLKAQTHRQQGIFYTLI